MIRWIKRKLCFHDWQQEKRPVKVRIGFTCYGRDGKKNVIQSNSKKYKLENRLFRYCEKCGRVEQFDTKITGFIKPRVRPDWTFIKYEEK